MHLNKYFSLFTLATIVSFGLNAQVFFSEDFDSNLDGWTSEVIIGSGGANESWVWTDEGSTGPFEIGALASTTAENGYAIFDSDLDCNIGTGQNAWLISPVIDASDKTIVWLRFETLYRSFYDLPQIRVGTDLNDLDSWDAIEVFPGIMPNDFGGVISGDPALNPQIIQINLSDLMAGESAVYFAFQFLSTTDQGPSNLIGCGYSWHIDDIILTEEDLTVQNDMRVNTFAAIAPNAQTPVSQVEPISFIADIQNVGAAEQANVNLNITITDEEGNEAFSDDLDYGSIAGDSLAENVFFANSFTPPAMEDFYTAVYSLTYDNEGEEFTPENNELSFSFAVTDTVFAKELFGATRSVAPVDDESYTYGNVFYIANGSSSSGADITARYISFGVANPEELAGRSVTTFLYEWPGDTDQDFVANQDEYSVVGFNSYLFTGNESDEELITIPINEEGFVPLTEGNYYIAAVQYTTDDDVNFFLQASEQFDYAAMNFITDSMAITSMEPLTRYAAALDVSNEGDLSMLGFGLDIVPVVRLSVDGSVNVDELLLPETAVSLFPNPVDKTAKIDFSLEEAADGTIEVYNINAQRVAYRELDAILNERVELNTEDWPAGNYMVRIRTDLGVRTLKMVVQH